MLGVLSFCVAEQFHQLAHIQPFPTPSPEQAVLRIRAENLTTLVRDQTFERHYGGHLGTYTQGAARLGWFLMLESTHRADLGEWSPPALDGLARFEGITELAEWCAVTEVAWLVEELSETWQGSAAALAWAVRLATASPVPSPG
jgi:hypothetical protein